MSTLVRCRCPLCGFLVTQERLNQEHDFEFVLHEITSKGRGKICNVYRRANVTDNTAFQVFRMNLAERIYAVADRLVEKIRVEAAEGNARQMAIAQGEVVDAEYVELEPGGEIFPMVEDDYDSEESVVVVGELEVESEGGDETCYESEIEPEFVMQMDYRE